MNIGMLWYDNDPKTTLEQKIKKAVSFYEDKYGKKANLVYININQMPVPVNGVEVRSNRAVLPGHFWVGIGIEEAKA